MTTGKHSRSQRLRSLLLGYPRGVKRMLLVAVDLALLTMCLGAAFVLKFDSLAASLAVSPWLFACAVLSALLAFASLGLYRAVVRFMSFRVLFAIFFGGGLSALCVWLAGGRVRRQRIAQVAGGHLLAERGHSDHRVANSGALGGVTPAYGAVARCDLWRWRCGRPAIRSAGAWRADAPGRLC